MPYYYSQGERVHVGKGQLRGTVTEDQKHDSNLVKVARDDKPEGSVDGYYAHDLKPLTTEDRYFETMEKARKFFNVAPGQDFLTTILLANEPITHAGSILGGAVKAEKPKEEEPFRYRIGDRVAFKYTGKAGTIDTNVMPGDTNVRVKWDATKTEPVKTVWEHIRDLNTLHAPRETENPHQAEIDAIDAILQPLIVELEMKQAVVRKLNDAKKILKRQG